MEYGLNGPSLAVPSVTARALWASLNQASSEPCGIHGVSGGSLGEENKANFPELKSLDEPSCFLAYSNN